MIVVSMTNDKFTEQANKIYDLHTELIVDLEKYRQELGKLEGFANNNATKEVLSISHHFLMNGLQNSLYAQREAVIRAMRLEKEE